MTALEQYERLEAPGLFAPGATAQRVDVILSLGDATLTITDHREVALAHWSLAALERLNPGRRPALYAPGADAEERIEIDDAMMIAAIEKVRDAVDRNRPHPGRLRRRLILGSVILGVAAAVIWLPGALVSTAAGIAPDAARVATGDALLEEIARLSGRPCDMPDGERALDRLVSALAPHGPRRAVVLPGSAPGARSLPGGLIVLNRGVVEDHESVQVVAGYLLAEAQYADDHDPMAEVLQSAGVMPTLRFATTGSVPPESLQSYARSLLTAERPLPDAARLAIRFRSAGVPLAPLAYALDITGERTLAMIEADTAIPPAGGQPISDDDWIALRGICGG